MNGGFMFGLASDVTPPGRTGAQGGDKMRSLIRMTREFRLSALLDYFIPTELQVNPGSHRRARMFMISHVFGPILGSTLPLYLVAMDISRDYRVVIFLASILNFWIYPVLLRWTGRYQLLAWLADAVRLRTLSEVETSAFSSRVKILCSWNIRAK